MKFNLLICALIACLLPLVGVGQTIAKISLEEVEPSKFAYPVTIDLNSITELQDSLLIMVNISEEKPYEVPFQLDNLNGRKLTWMVKPKEGQTSYSFELRKKIEREFPMCFSLWILMRQPLSSKKKDWICGNTTMG